MNKNTNLIKNNKYKSSNYRTYNFKVPDKYDNSIWIPIFKINELDKSIVSDLQNEISDIHILDVGCATGRLLEVLALAGAKHLYGTDIAPNILGKVKERAKKLNVNIDLQVADVENKIPWEDECFDVVTLTGVFHHFINPEDALQEIYRVLKTNGLFIIVEPRFPIIIRQIINFYLKIFMHEGDHKFYAPKKITTIAETIGFKEDGKPINVARFIFKIKYRK